MTRNANWKMRLKKSMSQNTVNSDILINVCVLHTTYCPMQRKNPFVSDIVQYATIFAMRIATKCK